ncbi:MAG: Fic family protein [Legionella sp.]|nr:Fic family protein [Legionella sp.]
MFGFFDYTKNLFYSYMNPQSYQLLEIIRPDPGCPDPEAAKDFIKENQNNYLNFYLKKKFDGYDVTVLEFCMGHHELMLVEALLNHPSMKDRKNHDWRAVFQCIAISFNSPEILSRLIEFFTNRLPVVKQQKLHMDSITTDSPMDSYNHYFSDFPQEEIWRLFIDGNKQSAENGWLDYEIREPGYMTGMINGLLHVKERICDPLTVELLLELHIVCSTNVTNLNESTPGEFRHEKEVEFAFHHNVNASVAGLIELIQYQIYEEPTFRVEKLPLHGGRLGIRATAQLSGDVHQNAQEIISHYLQSMVNCYNNEEKINAIIDLITAFERLHPFTDANCRTICILLLNRELIRNGFPPVILDDPNRFDAYSKSELFNEINKGMLTFNQVKQGNIKYLGITTDEVQIKINKELKYTTCSNASEYLKINSYSVIRQGIPLSGSGATITRHLAP